MRRHHISVLGDWYDAQQDDDGIWVRYDDAAATIAAVTAERDRLAKACDIYRMVAESAQAQWGADYLWQKWGHDEDMKAAQAELEKKP